MVSNFQGVPSQENYWYEDNYTLLRDTNRERLLDLDWNMSLTGEKVVKNRWWKKRLLLLQFPKKSQVCMTPKATFAFYLNQGECLMALDYHITIVITINDDKYLHLNLHSTSCLFKEHWSLFSHFLLTPDMELVKQSPPSPPHTTSLYKWRKWGLALSVLEVEPM